MKKLLSLFLLITMLSSMCIVPTYAAEKNNSITMDELNDLMHKYNINPEIVDSNSVSKDLIRNITKNELENVIIKALKEKEYGPKVINIYEKIDINQLIQNSKNNDKFINSFIYKYKSY